MKRRAVIAACVLAAQLGAAQGIMPGLLAWVNTQESEEEWSVPDGVHFDWPLNGNALDASGNGYNGTVSGATLTNGVTGAANTAYYFSGASTHNIGVTVTNLALADNNGITISMWARPRLTSTGFAFMLANSSEEKNHYACFIRDDGDVVARSNDPVSDAEASAFASANTWYHICCVFRYNPRDRMLYINGVQRAYSSVSAATFASDLFRIGYASDSTPNLPFPGSIDAVRVWNRPLSTNEIDQLYKEFD